MKEFTDVTALMVAQPEEHKHRAAPSCEVRIACGWQDSGGEVQVHNRDLGKAHQRKGRFQERGIHRRNVDKQRQGLAGSDKEVRHIAKQPHKTTAKIRHVGCLGPATPPKVLFTVPHARSDGIQLQDRAQQANIQDRRFNETRASTRAQGSRITALIKNSYILIGGSVPGPAKRLVRIRKAIRRAGVAIKEPTISYIAIAR